MWFLKRSDTNRAVQVQKMGRGWKFWIMKVQEFYYPCSKNKGTDQLCNFAYAKCWFSHDTAHFFCVYYFVLVIAVFFMHKASFLSMQMFP